MQLSALFLLLQSVRVESFGFLGVPKCTLSIRGMELEYY